MQWTHWLNAQTRYGNTSRSMRDVKCVHAADSIKRVGLTHAPIYCHRLCHITKNINCKLIDSIKNNRLRESTCPTVSKRCKCPIRNIPSKRDIPPKKWDFHTFRVSSKRKFIFRKKEINKSRNESKETERDRKRNEKNVKRQAPFEN